MRKRNKTKTKDDLHVHFHRRLIERYDVVASPHEINEAIKRIQDGKSVHISRLSNRVSNHLVRMNVRGALEEREIWVAVGYDNQRKALSTALPQKVVDETLEKWGEDKALALAQTENLASN